ncbi:hypothetical protein IMSHALPRED_010330 [Imshaugia aleurites]|uniref:F-box domain-containing protein n=1 Tax=Imshaugia aleurites TaxID=172621 RepID=A0A8H3G364_9LECA|nr:hypothetical protein IMSHALPRED_010330 [Imshaugia aleurites]
MPQLMELPNETLEQIMESFFPDDIDSFSVCCKHFYVLSARKFPSHKDMKNHYSRVSYLNVNSRTDHPLRLLQALCENPDRAMYVKNWSMDSVELYNHPKELRDIADDLQEELQTIVNSFTYLTAEEKETWIQRIQSGRPGPAAALAAFMLPCLERLVVDDGHEKLEMLEELMVAAARPGHTPRAKALGKLSHVCLIWDRTFEQDGRSERHFKPFASLIHLSTGLPSMRRFEASGIIDTGDKWPATHSKSTLKQLFLHRCELRPETLRQIIGSIAALQEFSYDFYLEDDTDHLQALKEIVQSLLLSASHSLISLDLTEHWHKSSGSIHACLFIGSLRGFQLLTEIRVEYRMFVENYPQYSVRGVRTHRMIDILPVTTEMVTLTGPMMDKEDVARLVGGLGKHKAKKLPQLEKVRWESTKSIAELKPFKTLFSNVKGIEFILRRMPC